MSFRGVSNLQSGPLLNHQQDFDRFYDSYAPSVYGYLLRQTNNAQLAETRLTDTFQAAWNRREEFNQAQSSLKINSPLSWLLSIVHQIDF